MKTALYAALIHDLCRPDNISHDNNHGHKAVNKYESPLRKRQLLNDEDIKKCMEAVIYHCKDLNKDNSEYLNKNNKVWSLLKNADSLDRGRFASPKKPKKGCNVGYLLNIQDRLKKPLAWLAHQLAYITYNTNWSDGGFVNIKKVIMYSVKDVALKNGILDEDKSQLAKDIYDILNGNVSG